MFDGLMFLPLEVMMSSFLRPVIDTKPSPSISAMSPVRQPAVGQRLLRRLLVLEVAAEDASARA